MQIQGLGNITVPVVQLQQTSPIKGAAVGDKLNAEVVSSQSGKVTLQLPDGTKVVAQQRAFAALQQGDTVQLEVLQSGNTYASLRLSTVNGQSMATDVSPLEHALMRMGVPASSTFVAYAKTLEELGVSLSPATLSRMDMLAKQFPDMPLTHNALFAATALPATEENVAQFSAFLAQPTSTTEFAQALNALAKENPAAARLFVALYQGEQLQAQAASPAGNTGEAAPQAQAAAPQAQAAAPLPAGLSESTAMLLTEDGAWAAITKETVTPGQAQAFVNGLGQEIPAADKQLLLEALAQPEAKAQAAPQEGAKAMAQAAPMLTEEAAGSAAPAAARQAPTQMTLDQIVQGLFATLEKAAQQGQGLKQATSGLPGKVQALSGVLTTVGDTTGAAGAKAAAQLSGALVTQLNLGNEMGNLMYAQIPWMTPQQEKHNADLYILKREHSGKTVDSSNATIALCLDTQYMGRLETLLRVERNDINLQFRVEQEHARRYVRDQLYRLQSLVFPAQYRLNSARVLLQKEQITTVNAGKTLQSAFGIISAGTLDMSV